ncbi:MAG: preprotein translocase subunit YajC [Kiritimatiellia bacterium]|jgi:preprotein translocase subunit YajC|nr:preprotein translocase subunit YajC [Kiritimatiellia bacterium]MDP6630698.1 preprotein translocase subunit YajC [Kiritimatiellia bacterium]MDP6809439.1 preprotein translocase subunit YajC [Kiritimatiellia bacterium]MDP7023884.1 preprotein translocase subunit YajC [Kiritimatiellia bacterium]
MIDILGLIAMAAPAEGQQGSPFGMMVPMLFIFAIFYFMLIRPQQRKEKERKKLINELKTGERVMFSGGIIGTVTNVKDAVFVIKIADGVKIEVARGAVSRILEKGEKPEEVE